MREGRDGRKQLVAGAPGEEGEQGAVYVAGAEGLALLARGAIGGGRFGAALAALPDLNGDGLGEVLIGAPLGGGGNLLGVQHDAPGPGEVVLLVSDAQIVWRASGQASGEGFGSSLAVAALAGGGSLVVVGSPTADPDGKTDAGGAYLLDESGRTMAFIPGTEAGQQVVTSVLVSSDQDGDGIPALVLVPANETESSVVLEGLIWWVRSRPRPAEMRCPPEKAAVAEVAASSPRQPMGPIRPPT